MSLIDSDDWPPVANISDSSNAPLAKFKSSKTQSAYYTPTSAPSPPIKNPYASAPAKSSASSRSPTKPSSSTKPSSTSYKSKFNGKNRKFSPMEKWKITPPSSGSPQTVQKNGRTWYWCQKCRYGKGRWSTTHSTAQHRPKPTKTHQANISVNTTDDNLGVWCTAVDDDSSSDTHHVYSTATLSDETPSFVSALGVLMGLLLCLYTCLLYTSPSPRDRG